MKIREREREMTYSMSLASRKRREARSVTLYVNSDLREKGREGRRDACVREPERGRVRE